MQCKRLKQDSVIPSIGLIVDSLGLSSIGLPGRMSDLACARQMKNRIR
jgi:hypothetical protein